jgi:hypothetical protein
MKNRAFGRFFQELVPKLTEFWNKLNYHSICADLAEEAKITKLK